MRRNRNSTVQKQFGAYIKRLRSERIYINRQGVERQWSQAHLAEKADLDDQQIAKLERGEIVDLEPFLEKLQEAFNLQGLALKEFFAVAGYPYPLEIEYEKDQIRWLLSTIPYPTSVRTPLWDFIAFNRYHALLYGYTDEFVEKLKQGKLGANLLRMLFDPEVRGYGLSSLRDTKQLQEGLERSVRVFRSMSAPFVNEPRYKVIINELLQFREFARIWKMLSTDENEVKLLDYLPFREVHHPQVGTLQFLSSRVPPRYLNDNLDISVYTPTPSSWSKYQELFGQLSENEVYFFG